jgi:hypothetical protein
MSLFLSLWVRSSFEQFKVFFPNGNECLLFSVKVINMFLTSSFSFNFVYFLVSKVWYLSPKPKHLSVRWISVLYSLKLNEYSLSVCFPMFVNNFGRICFMQCKSLKILWMHELVQILLNAKKFTLHSNDWIGMKE